MTIKQTCNGLSFLHSKHLSINTLPTSDNTHYNMTAASEEVDNNLVSENAGNINICYSDDSYDNSDISYGDDSDDKLTNEPDAFFDALESENDDDPL